MTILRTMAVERDIAGQLVAQPALQDPRALLAHRLLFVPQQVGPLECPEIGELGALDQAIDELVAFGRVCRFQERARFRRIGQPADRVEKRPTQEDRITAERRRIDAQGFQLGEDESVDRALRFSAVPDEPGPVGEESEAAGRAAIHVADGDRLFHRAAGVNLPVIGDVGTGRVADIVGSLAGDVAGRAVVE